MTEQAVDRFLGRELSKHEPQRMCPIQLVVAITDDDEGGRRLDPTPEECEHVERCLVGGMHVFEHENRGLRPKLV